mmetsp:Transcript_15944/g.41029  ORF Transcript_15944/g.41029 Transcript_15944/m.41029 type:complete len:309 (+) Transcript_15944:248-1174(+)
MRCGDGVVDWFLDDHLGAGRACCEGHPRDGGHHAGLGHLLLRTVRLLRDVVDQSGGCEPGHARLGRLHAEHFAWLGDHDWKPSGLRELLKHRGEVPVHEQRLTGHAECRAVHLRRDPQHDLRPCIGIVDGTWLAAGFRLGRGSPHQEPQHAARSVRAVDRLHLPGNDLDSIRHRASGHGDDSVLPVHVDHPVAQRGGPGARRAVDGVPSFRFEPVWRHHHQHGAVLSHLLLDLGEHLVVVHTIVIGEPYHLRLGPLQVHPREPADNVRLPEHGRLWPVLDGDAVFHLGRCLRLQVPGRPGHGQRLGQA